MKTLIILIVLVAVFTLGAFLTQETKKVIEIQKDKVERIMGIVKSWLKLRLREERKNRLIINNINKQNIRRSKSWQS